MVKFTDMEISLNREVGKLAPDVSSGNAGLYERKDIDNQTYELVRKRPDNCSYALQIRKIDSVITGWHFLQSPAPTGCKFQDVRQLM